MKDDTDPLSVLTMKKKKMFLRYSIFFALLGIASYPMYQIHLNINENIFGVIVGITGSCIVFLSEYCANKIMSK